jgi:hypothetical protein
MKVRTNLKAGQCYAANSVFYSDRGMIRVVDPVCSGDYVNVKFTDGTEGIFIIP